MNKKLSAAQIIDRVQGKQVGTGNPEISGVASLVEAGPEHLSFLGNPKYKSQVLPSAAGIVLVPRDFDSPPPTGRVWIQCDKPSEAFSQFISFFAPPPIKPQPGIHETAWVAPNAVVPASVYVGPGTVIEAAAVIGENTIIHGGSYIGNEVRIGANCLLHPQVTVLAHCRLGDRAIVHSGVVIGSDGFGFTEGTGTHEKVPQVGIVQIDEDVEIGANTTIDRARFGRTWIQKGVKIDNLVQVAHNVVVEENCILVAQCGIAGSTRLKKNVIIAGQVGVSGHLTIGENTIIMAKSGVPSDVPPGQLLIGVPTRPRADFFRQQASLGHLPDLLKTVRRLEKRIAELENKQKSS